MQSTRHDGNLAALHASSLPGYVLDVVVLTADGGLLATLREASSPEHAIWHAPSADAAVDYLVGGRCGILVADLGTLRADAASLLARLHTQFPELVLMATGRRDEEAAVASLVGDGRVYRFLHKPVSPARASLFLGAATRRYYELRNTEPVVFTTVKTIAQRPRTLQIAGAFAAVAVIAIAGAWWFASSRHLDPANEQAIESAARTQAQIEELLGRANMALATGRLSEPRGDNALERYREVLELAPNHPEATAGVERVIATLEARVVAALQARDPQAGAVALTDLQRARPNHPRYQQLYDELIGISRSQPPPQARTSTSRVQPAIPAEATATAPPIKAPQARLETSAIPVADTSVQNEPEATLEQAPAQHETSAMPVEETPVRDEDEAALEEPQFSPATEQADAHADALEVLALAIRLRERGQLIEPAESNAFDTLAALRSEYPNIPEIAQEQRRLTTTLVDHARTLLVAGELEAARAFLDKAAQLDPDSPVVRSLRAQREAALAERESKRVISAGALKRTREVSPEYPYDAQARGIEGWVDVEFTIARDGTTREVMIRNSEPKDLFDRSALDALRRWRFEPIVRNGQPTEQRAMIRIEYRLKN